ncbi:MAG: NAD(P)-dependent oxidoreductase [Acidobacteriota bacterium]|nr:NAD(P)-dependent oxidoreductase [Acidobacteriota bacterium]
MKCLVTGGTGFIGWRVAKNLLSREIPVVVADSNLDPATCDRLKQQGGDLAHFSECDVSDSASIDEVLKKNPGTTHAIHLAYLMSAEVEANPPLGIRVNVLGMVNMFEAAARHKLSRLVFTSSETVYGASQKVFGARPVTESDYCGPHDHYFTYGVMKILNEFMAEKYVARHGLSIACIRPPVVFGHGRKRGAVLWAESFISLPAIGQPVHLPFPSESRDCWIYVDDCAEQLVRLTLKPQLSHFVYNSGGHSVSAAQLAEAVRHWLPEAQIVFDQNGSGTPLVDDLDGRRLIEEIGFTPRLLGEGVLAHINEARASAGVSLLNPFEVI